MVDNQTLFENLKELKIIENTKLEELFKNSEEQNKFLGDLLLEQDLISDENLGKIIADNLSTPYINLANTSISKEILNIVPEVVARKQKIIAFEKNKDGLKLAMVNPANNQIKEFIAKKTGLPVTVYLATERDISNAFSQYAENVNQVFDEIIKENISQAQINKSDISIIKIVDTIFSYAYKNKASDIHIEPEKEISLVRFRIDGVLHDIVKFPIDIHGQIVTRIKVMAKLRIDEHASGQDGKLQVPIEDDYLDVRVSIVPITNGEKIVMRLLSKNSKQFTLENLGFSEENIACIETAYKKPFGMILSTGPTGSGKTTTLYTILKKLNNRDVNIMTIEDPVEYEIENINQIQVNSKTNLTFAEGLRSIVRQDPNIILVGEIRDDETANIAVNSAMTGHLVLSTLHTNDAATAIPRLFDMRVESFLVASSVSVIIGQRLVRTICPKCRVSIDVSVKDYYKILTPDIFKKHFGKKKIIRIYHGKGCPVCHNTGYKDRIAIAEVLVIDDDVRQAITERKDASTIRQIAVRNGMTKMVDDGLTKVKEGITTLDEIIRVTKE